MKRVRGFAAYVLIAMLSLPLAALAQTPVKAPSNPYKPAEDVQAGRQAAAEVERQLPLVRDSFVQDYINIVGNRLVESIPREYQHPEFRYSFKVVDVRDLNAFALPGGFTYVNRGLIEAARNEGELAGVMAHEISHVALRHGTAQAAKGQKYAVGAAAGQILGAILGGPLGGVVAQGSQLGIGAYFLKFSREYERQADTLGAQIMANAGYDPRDLANMFRTLEREAGGKGGPEWLSSHPNPGNRYEAINREAEMLRVSGTRSETGEFRRVQAALSESPRARSMEEVARSGQRQTSNTRYPSRTSSRPGEPPSRNLQVFRSSDGAFRVNYPSNWSVDSPNSYNITFAPDWAHEGGELTHGAMVNYAELNDSRGSISLDEAMNAIVNQLQQSNQYLREERGQRYSGQLSGRQALATFLTGRNQLGYNERVWVIARPAGQGVIYMLFIAPEREFSQYQPTFEAMIRSFEVDRRIDVGYRR